MDPGEWLVSHSTDMAKAEAEWLTRLAEFDRDQLFALDGQQSCAGWLMWKTHMGRSTAFEKLRVAHELTRRPIVAEAFAQGALSYSLVRTLTRMDRPDPEVDEALVELVTSGRATVPDIEMLVRSYNLYADQDKPPAPELQRRDVRIRRSDGGYGQIIITLPDDEISEFEAVVQAFMDLRRRDEPVDESPAGDSDAPAERATYGAKRAFAFLDLLATALAHADQGHAGGDDRYMVHYITTDGQSLAHLDGSPVERGVAATITCDCSRVTHTHNAAGEVLNLGRKTRDWSTAQRRAVRIRDRDRCRFPGCQNRLIDIHHMIWWEHGGPTDIDNGFSQCRYHHGLLHAGYCVEGDPQGELRFFRPGRTYFGSTFASRAFTP